MNKTFEARVYEGRAERDLVFHRIIDELIEQSVIENLSTDERINILRESVKRDNNKKKFFINYLILHQRLLSYSTDPTTFDKDFLDAIHEDNPYI